MSRRLVIWVDVEAVPAETDPFELAEDLIYAHVDQGQQVCNLVKADVMEAEWG